MIEICKRFSQEYTSHDEFVTDMLPFVVGMDDMTVGNVY